MSKQDAPYSILQLMSVVFLLGELGATVCVYMCICAFTAHVCGSVYSMCCVNNDASSSLRSDSKTVQKPLWLALDEIQVHVTKSSRGTGVPM